MESDGSQPLPSVCKTCNARFINELLRIQHVRHTHPESLQFSCKLCGIKCESQGAITRHVRNKHRKKKKDPAAEASSVIAPTKNTAKLPIEKSLNHVKLQKNTSKAVSKVSPQWRARVEMACMRYAMVHGKHKAQLRYAQLEPGCKIGWRRLTELLSLHKHDKTGKKAAYLYKRGRKGKKDMQLAKLAIPTDIKSDCGKFAVTYGIDDAQWEFTLRYPNYIFSYASVRNWCEAERMKLEKDPNLDKPFDEAFVTSLNEALINTKPLSITEVEKTIKSKVEIYNEEVNDNKKVVHDDNAVEEWLHGINNQVSEKKKVHLVQCACGNAYRTEKELAKHKPKCWLPDFKAEAQVRSQRSCRNKTTPSECETISDSDSGSSSVIEETYCNPFKCSDCEYSTPQEFRYKRHIKSCHKKKLLSEKILSNKLMRDGDQSNNNSELFTFKNCKKCSFKHITIEGLREHYRVVHNSHYTDSSQEISLLCTKCNDTFLTYAGLREHVCGERQITVKYERIKPRIPSSIMVGTNSSVVFLCPRCVTRFNTIQDLKEHYTAKSCAKSKLYA